MLPNNTKILYLEASKRDFTRTFLENNPRHFFRNEDGKIDAVTHMTPAPPWAYIRPGATMNCMYWHHVLFRHVFNSQKVPIQCQNCWKVVLMPRDLEELFACYFLQHEMGRACKCGTETERDNTPRHYGGYWYNNSLQEGMECYNAVREAVDRDRVFEGTLIGCPVKVRFGDGYDTPVPVILKRACTEFEQACGPSDQWGWDDEQVELERLAFDSFSQEITHSRQTDIQLSTIFMDWIHRAFRIGDEKYLKFTNGNRLFPPPVTYHDMPKKELDAFKKRTVVCPR